MLALPATVLLAFAQLSAGQPLDIDGVHGLDQTLHHEIDSEIVEHRYDVLVKLPSSYDESADMRYPVIYVLDAGVHFPVLASYHQYMTNSGAVPDVIIVGVSYGTSDWRQGNNRSHDFTAPSAERDFWGGAEDYLEFLSAELLPAIANTYRTDVGRRVIFGQSLGGQFVLFAAQTRPEVFWGYIASNPALHRNLDFFLETVPAAAPTRRLFVSSSENDNPVFREPALEWIGHWDAIEDPPWALHTTSLEGHDHFSAPPVAYRLGLQWVFAEAVTPSAE